MFNYDEFVHKYGKEVANRVRDEVQVLIGLWPWKVHVESTGGMNFIFVASKMYVTIIVEKDKSLYVATNFTRFQAEKGLEMMNELKGWAE